MDIFSTYATDESKETEGVWQEIGDAKFLIARSGNPNYVKKLSKLFEQNQKSLERKDDAADKLSEKLMVDVLAGTILLGWENVQFKGEALPYSHENAVKLLGVKDFRKQVVQLSDDFGSYKLKLEADQEKN